MEIEVKCCYDCPFMAEIADDKYVCFGTDPQSEKQPDGSGWRKLTENQVLINENSPKWCPLRKEPITIKLTK